MNKGERPPGNGKRRKNRMKKGRGIKKVKLDELLPKGTEILNTFEVKILNLTHGSIL
jgi:hypothetical protein